MAITWSVVFYRGRFHEWKDIEKNACVMTTERLSIIIAIVLSIIFLKEKVTWQIILGGTMMVSGALLIALSNIPFIYYMDIH
ncbi:hypothetical protein [Pedobacter sp. JCM 36344]|uniref:hypothetical protein n=1 Tax=Pedobacter sp. JCM 36344 TaxID=3374280 RepID=UPI00397DC7B5